MIQRIQTVFLFFAFVLVGLLFFIPFAGFISAEVYSLSLMGLASPKGVDEIQQPIWLTALGALATIAILVTIFVYKNRKLQMKLTIFTIISALLLNGAMYWAAQTYKSLFAAEYSFKVAFIFPLLAAILLFLAYRSIRKDEQLIKSLDRLR